MPDRWPILTVYYGTKPDLAYVFAKNQKDANKLLDEYGKRWPQGNFVLTGESRRDPNPPLKRLFDDLEIARDDLFGQKGGWTGFKIRTSSGP